MLTQLVQSRHPSGDRSDSGDGRHEAGRYLGGSAEFGMANAAMAQIGQFYRLPLYNSAGMTDAKIPDIQAGFEKGIGAVLAALAGSNYIHHAAGMLENMSSVARRAICDRQ